MKLKYTLLASALFLANASPSFAAIAPAALGSGVYFYAWNANAYCSTTDSADNPTGKCPELWTNMIKNINAQIPASSDRAKIKFIYLDSITPNLQTQPSTQTIFTVGGCSDQTDINFCSSSGGIKYVSTQNQDGFQAVSDLNTALGAGYYILPMFSDSGDSNLQSLTSDQIKSLAYSLACIVNPNATPPSFSGTGFPKECTDVLTGPNFNKNHLSPSLITGLAFDVEGPDFSHLTGDTDAANDFYTTLQTAMGTSAKFVMVSRGPGGLNEKQNSTYFGSTLENLNTNNLGYATFIFSPQIYDLCDGMGLWACPLNTPFPNPLLQPNNTVPTPTYSNNLLMQPIPLGAYPKITKTNPPGSSDDSTPPLKLITWADNLAGDFSFVQLSMPALFFADLKGPLSNIQTTTYFPDVPVQTSISAGSSSQIWSQMNFYNADFTDSPSTATNDPYLANINPDQSSTAPINFQPFMIYMNKKACQAENPDGSLGATIPGCVSYPNPYGESIASYANAFFANLQNILAFTSKNNIQNSVFSGVTLYPFTPYGFWDTTCTKNIIKTCPGFLPEIPDGLVNGQKPEHSFWTTYLSQFANQWIGSSTGTIPTETSTPNPTLFVTLPPSYYTLNAAGANGEASATILISPPTTYPAGASPLTIAGYTANLIDAIGQTAATGTCNLSQYPSLPGTSGQCGLDGSGNNILTLNNAPGGNYLLQVQALDATGNVIASTEAAAEGPGAPVPPMRQVTITIQSATITQIPHPPTNLFYTYQIAWSLICPPGINPPGHLATISTVNGINGNTPFDESIIGGATPTNPPATCGGTFTSTFTTRGANYSIAAGEDVSLFLIDNQYQRTTQSVSTILSGNPSR